MLRSLLSAVLWVFGFAYAYILGMSYIDFHYLDYNALFLLGSYLGLLVAAIALVLYLTIKKGKLP